MTKNALFICLLALLWGCGDAADPSRDANRVDSPSGPAGKGDQIGPDDDCHDAHGGDGDGGASEVLTLTYDVHTMGGYGWYPMAADFSRGDEGIDFDSEVERMPEAYASQRPIAYRLSGTNVSGDLAMVLVKELNDMDGVEPGQTYEVAYRITFASDAPSGCTGEAPGELVWLKAGATATDPMKVVGDDGWVRLNVDKGNHGTGGEAASVVGDVANGIPCEEARAQGMPLATVVREHTHSHVVTADEYSRLWLLVLTDSAYAGRTTIYYQTFEVTLRPVL